MDDLRDEVLRGGPAFFSETEPHTRCEVARVELEDRLAAMTRERNLLWGIIKEAQETVRVDLINAEINCGRPSVLAEDLSRERIARILRGEEEV